MIRELFLTCLKVSTRHKCLYHIAYGIFARLLSFERHVVINFSVLFMTRTRHRKSSWLRFSFSLILTTILYSLHHASVAINLSRNNFTLQYFVLC